MDGRISKPLLRGHINITKCVGEQIVTGFRLQGNQIAKMFGFETSLEPRFVDSFGSVDELLSFGT